MFKEFPVGNGKFIQGDCLEVLKAWEHLGIPIPLKIIGEGPLASAVKESAQKMPWIEAMGKKNLSEVYNLMGQAQTVLFPTKWYETFGRVIIEAYAKGTPVIASNIGSGSQLVKESQTGLLFLPGDVDDLVQKVRWLWGHPVEMAQMGQNARREYEQKYSADKNYDMLMDIYQRAIVTNRAEK